MSWLAPAVRAAIVVGLSVAYVGSVFRVWEAIFWNASLADWVDPYFINSLLESWYYSLRRFENPASPPVFYPTSGTLGYSHGLILYVPFYVPLRALLHPFQAYNATILLVVLTGTWCLYGVLRRAFQLSFVEACALTACFACSANVLNEPLNVWTQRASVYLVPPILLAGWTALQGGRSTWLAAFLTGLLGTLLYTQDFYSGHFTWFFAACGLIALSFHTMSLRVREWSWLERVAAVVALLGGAWSAYLTSAGGGAIELAGFRIRSNDPSRPFVVAAIALAVLVLSRVRRCGWRPPRIAVTPPFRAFGAGALLGSVVFLWIYLPVYLDFGGFQDDEYLRVLKPRAWTTLLDPRVFLARYEGFGTLQPFALIAMVTAVAWIRWRVVSRRVRIATIVWLAVSAAVLLIPFRFGEFSVWGTLIRPLPGFNAIRDPLRIIYQYQLAVVIAAAAVMASLPRRDWGRIALTGTVILGLYLAPNTTVMKFGRPNEQYNRWVAAPIRIDPSCQSFYMAEAPPEYEARSPELWTLYSNDAAFIGLRLGIPTLHGVSAWTPHDWHVRQPRTPEFAWGVRDWIERHGLTDVCVMDVGRRTMLRAGE